MAAESLHNYFAVEPEQIMIIRENSEEEKTETQNSLENIEIEPKFESDLTSSTIPVIKKFPPRGFTGNKIKSEATKKRDLALKKRKIFKQFVDFCVENSFHKKLTKTEHDYEKIFDLDHCYTTPDDEKAENSSKKFFFRQLFLTHYDHLISSSSQNEIFTGGNEINLSDNHEKSKFFFRNADMETFTKDSFFAQCEEFAAKIASILIQEREEIEKRNETTERCWEESLKESVTNSNLRNVVEKIIKILLDQMLAKRAVDNRPDEMNIMENTRIKNAARLRLAFSAIVADRNSIEFINTTFMKHLPMEILSIYIGLWKILKPKVPELVSRIFDAYTSADDDTKNISAILKEFFDSKSSPTNSNRVNFKNVGLAKNPIIVLISPNFKVYGHLSESSGSCREFFKNYFPQLGKCSEIKFNPLRKDFSLFEANQKLLNVIVEKLIEIRVGNPTRHMILVGWDASCLIALITALEFPLAACVCLAFPNVTLNGIRGDVDDDILDVACPVLFVVGQFSSTCSIDDLQDTIEQMKSAKVGVVVVGGANSELKSNFKKLCTENLTQNIVDKCIMDTIGEFLNDVLVTLPDISPPKPVSVVADSQVQSLDSQISPMEPDAKRRCPDRSSELKLTIKIPPVLEPELPASQKMNPSPAFRPVPSMAATVEPVIKVQQRPRSSSAGTNLFFNIESPLGAYASGLPPGHAPIQAQMSMDVDRSDSFDDGDHISASGSTTPAVTRTRLIKKPLVFDL